MPFIFEHTAANAKPRTTPLFPSYRVPQTAQRRGLYGLHDSESPLAAQIVRVAEAWLEYADGYQGGNVDGNNLSPIVKKINGCAGVDPNAVSGGQGGSYCATWVYLVVKGAMKCLQANTCLSLEAGSTRRMLDAAKRAGVRVDTTPAVGAVFFRGRMYYDGRNKGLSKNSDTLGHNGIVTNVLPDGGFECIDANGRQSELSGVAVARDRYTRAEIDKFNKSDNTGGKFQFIHVEECRVSGTQPLEITGFGNDCMPLCVPPRTPTPPSERPSEPPSRTPLPPTERPQEPNRTPPRETVNCSTVKIIPCSKALEPSGKIEHFSVFRSMDRSVKEGWFSRYSSEDSAVILPSSKDAILARLPMVQDRFGKKIIISSDDPEIYGGEHFQRMNSMELWGKDVVFYHIPRRWKGGFLNQEDRGWVGGGWAQRAALELLTPTNDGGASVNLDAMRGWFTWDGSNRNEVNGKRINRPDIARRWNDFKPDSPNFWGIMEKIERLGAANSNVPSVYVLVLEGQVGTFFEENTELIITAATAAAVVAALAVTILSGGTLTAGAVAGVAATATAIRSALTPIITKAAKREEITLADIVTAAANTAGAIAANSNDPAVKQAAQQVQQYAQKATRAMSAFAKGDYMAVARELSAEAQRAFPQITGIVGEGGKKVEGMFLLANGAFADVQNIIGGNAKDIAGSVNQWSKALNMDSLLKAVTSGNLDSLFGGGSEITQNPVLRNLLLSESTGQAVGLIPNIGEVAAHVMKTDNLSRANIQSPENFADFGGLALGLLQSSNTFESLQLNGLFERAEQFARNNLRFALPPEIPADRRECYEREIMQCTGIGAQNCADDEERNPETGRCEKKKYVYPAEWEQPNDGDDGKRWEFEPEFNEFQQFQQFQQFEREQQPNGQPFRRRYFREFV